MGQRDSGNGLKGPACVRCDRSGDQNLVDQFGHGAHQLHVWSCLLTGVDCLPEYFVFEPQQDSRTQHSKAPDVCMSPTRRVVHRHGAGTAHDRTSALVRRV